MKGEKHHMKGNSRDKLTQKHTQKSTKEVTNKNRENQKGMKQ